jgi:hypothetical protein
MKLRAVLPHGVTAPFAAYEQAILDGEAEREVGWEV